MIFLCFITANCNVIRVHNLSKTTEILSIYFCTHVVNVAKKHTKKIQVSTKNSSHFSVFQKHLLYMCFTLLHFAQHAYRMWFDVSLCKCNMSHVSVKSRSLHIHIKFSGRFENSFRFFIWPPPPTFNSCHCCVLGRACQNLYTLHRRTVNVCGL